MVMTLDYTFTQEDVKVAYDSWGCNCGPSSLAFAVQVPLDFVRDKIHGFDEKRYTTATMMYAAIANCGREFSKATVRKYAHGQIGLLMDMCYLDCINLVRIQWQGPWTEKNQFRQAARHSHWIAAWCDSIRGPSVFDVNGGIMTFREWEDTIVPAITATVPRSNGLWHPTHVLKIA